MKTPATYTRLIAILPKLPESEQVRLLRSIVSPSDLQKILYTFREDSYGRPVDSTSRIAIHRM